MLRTDGVLPPLQEDRLVLDRVWMDRLASRLVYYCFGWRTSVAQALRVVDPGTPFELVRLEMWAEDSNLMGLEDAPLLETAGEAFRWLVSQVDRGDLINFDCRLENGLELNSHDDTQVTLQGPEGSWVHDWAKALLASRGFAAEAIMEALELNAGKYLAIGWPDGVLGIYETVDELRKAHRKR